MLDHIFEEFKLQFPGIANQTTDWYESDIFEITANLSDGTSVIYDSFQRTIRNKRDLSGYLTEQEWRKEFSRKLYRRILISGKTQMDISNTTGLSQHIISKYINGSVTPSAYNISLLAKALKCSFSDLTNFN